MQIDTPHHPPGLLDMDREWQTVDGRAVTYVRDRRTDPLIGDERTRISERRRGFSAGDINAFPYVVRIGDLYETVNQQGFAGHGSEHTANAVINAPVLDFSKPVKTREGQAVRVLCQDAPEPYPIVGLIDGYTSPVSWSRQGRMLESQESRRDLVNYQPKPKTKKVWVNFYFNHCGNYHVSEADALAAVARHKAGGGREARTLEIEVPAE